MGKKVFYIAAIFVIFFFVASCECQPAVRSCWGRTPSATIEEKNLLSDTNDAILETTLSPNYIDPPEESQVISFQAYMRWRLQTE
ncbi:MAG: hypothetical protein FWD87_06245 [Spirochaetaceae bacterium]|nr:hypothetical protein [Spirochaetaceae bacterium]